MGIIVIGMMHYKLNASAPESSLLLNGDCCQMMTVILFNGDLVCYCFSNGPLSNKTTSKSVRVHRVRVLRFRKVF